MVCNSHAKLEREEGGQAPFCALEDVLEVSSGHVDRLQCHDSCIDQDGSKDQSLEGKGVRETYKMPSSLFVASHCAPLRVELPREPLLAPVEVLLQGPQGRVCLGKVVKVVQRRASWEGGWLLGSQ